MPKYLLAIDQGTTNSRAIIFDKYAKVISQHEKVLTQYYPNEGWVEQNPDEMFQNTIQCCQEALKKAGLNASDIIAAGISNQRETTIVWDRITGQPIYPAIVWQDRRTHDICKMLLTKNVESTFRRRTGLLIDPYFSATKILWILENIPLARKRAEAGELLFGTVDSYLLWKLTDKKVHATDVTNAARTLLFNIQTQEWDEEILRLLDIPKTLLPSVLDNAAEFGDIAEHFLGGKIPIRGMAGDQQAATVGQACFAPSSIKITYGTGGFLLLNTGSQIIESQHQLLSTIAYRVKQQIIYGLEGSIFCTGAAVKWLRDTLNIITTAQETETLARSIKTNGDVYLVPAFTGLGAPYWDAEARGALLGLTRNSGKAHIARAALESAAYQTQDLLTAMANDSGESIQTLRVDGGMSVNNWFLQFLSDLLQVTVERPACIETSALGVAYLAGLQSGLYTSLEEINQQWRAETIFKPTMSVTQRDLLYQGWKDSIRRVKHAML